MVYRTAAQGIGAFFAIAAFIILLIALCTNSWITIQVNFNTALDTQLAYFPRNRGIFKECFSNPTATYLIKSMKHQLADDVDGCIKMDLDTQLPNVVYNSDVKARSALLVAQAVFLVFALFLIACAFVTFCFSIFVNKDMESRKWGLTVKWAGILLFLAGFSNALGMALFHGADYMETNIIKANDAQVPYIFFYKLAQPTALQEATVRRYDWSYALSWIAVFLEVLSATILFVCGACCGQEPNEKNLFDTSTIQSGKGFRNYALEYIEPGAPIHYNAPPMQLVKSDGAYYEHFNGRHFDPYSRGHLHQEFNPQYNYDEGGWKWQ